MKCRCAESALRDWRRCLFPITSSEASIGSQCAIKWSLSGWECRWTLCFSSTLFSMLMYSKQRGSSFNLFEVPSNLCLTFKSFVWQSGAQSWLLCAALLQQAVRCSHSRGKTNWIYTSESMWLLLLEIYSVHKSKCKTKWQKMAGFPAALKQSKGWRHTVTSFHLQARHKNHRNII